MILKGLRQASKFPVKQTLPGRLCGDNQKTDRCIRQLCGGADGVGLWKEPTSVTGRHTPKEKDFGAWGLLWLILERGRNGIQGGHGEMAGAMQWASRCPAHPVSEHYSKKKL